MFSELFTQLSPKQVTALTDMPPVLLTPPESTGNMEARLKAFAEYLVGDLTHDRAVKAALGEGRLTQAMGLMIEASEFERPLEQKMEEEIRRVWGEDIETKKRKIAEIKGILAHVPEKAIQWAQMASETLAQVESMKLPEVVPKSHGEIEAAKILDGELSRLEDDSLEIAEGAEKEIEHQQSEFRKVVKKAFNRLFESGDYLSDSHVENLFLCLPSLVQEGKIDLLKLIADTKQKLDSISVPPDLMSRRPTKRSRPQVMLSPFLSKPKRAQGTSRVSLSNMSETVFNGAPASKYRLNTHEDLEKIRQKADSLAEYHEQANVWLGAAKVCQDQGLSLIALGEGLLAEGARQVKDVQAVHARKLLLDAFSCLAKSLDIGETSLERAVLLLIGAYIWPKISHRKKMAHSIREWIDNPELVISYLKDGEYLDTVSMIWAFHIEDEADSEKYIQIISGNFGNDRLLLRHCARSLLTHPNLSQRTHRMISGLKWLLRGAKPSKEVYNTLERLSEITRAEGSSSSSAHALKAEQIASELRKFLNELPQDSVAPVREIIELLPSLLDDIAKKTIKKHLDTPSISLRKEVTVLYLAERCDDVELPVMVRNAENAAAASNVTVILRALSPKGRYAPEIVKNTEDVGDLMPGQQHEAIFFVNLIKEMAEECTELKFRVETHVGQKVSPTEITVGIRPGGRQRKKSPYTTGLPVTGADFVGREKEVRMLVNLLTGNTKKAAMVYGIRRIGKTSIVKHILEHIEIKPRYYGVFFDAEDVDRSATSSGFLKLLCDKILRDLPAKHTEGIFVDRAEFKENPYVAFSHFMGGLKKADLPKRVLLAIDEYDKLMFIAQEASLRNKALSKVPGPSETFQPEVLGALRKALQDHDFLWAIISGLPNIARQKYDDRMFGLLDPIEIKSFTNEEAEKIIKESERVMTIPASSREMILNASGLQPYLLQVICDKIFNRMINTGRDIVTSYDVNEVIENDILPNEKYFTDYESLIEDDREILYGLALAHVSSGSKNRTFASVDDINHHLHLKGIESEPEEILHILGAMAPSSSSELGERPLVERSKVNKRCFRLIIGLLGDHLIRQGMDMDHGF